MTNTKKFFCLFRAARAFVRVFGFWWPQPFIFDYMNVFTAQYYYFFVGSLSLSLAVVARFLFYIYWIFPMWYIDRKWSFILELISRQTEFQLVISYCLHTEQSIPFHLLSPSRTISIKNSFLYAYQLVISQNVTSSKSNKKKRTTNSQQINCMRSASWTNGGAEKAYNGTHDHRPHG